MGDIDINGDGYADEIEVYELADGSVAATIDVDGGGEDLLVYDADGDGELDRAWAVQDTDHDGDYDVVQEIPLGNDPGFGDDSDRGGYDQAGYDNQDGYGEQQGDGTFYHSDSTGATVSTNAQGEGYIAFDDGTSYSR